MLIQHLIDDALDMRELAFRKMEADKNNLIRRFQEHAEATNVSMPIEAGLQWYAASKKTLQIAETFVWTQETATRVLSAAFKLDDDIPFHRAWLPSPCGFWWVGRDSPWKARCDTYRDQLDLPEERRVCALGYRVGGVTDRDHDNHVLIETYTMEHGEPTRGPTVFHGVAWEEGETLKQFMARVALSREHNRRRYPQDHDSDWWNQASEMVGRLLMAGALWLQQKVVSFSHHHPYRAQQKRLERYHIESKTRIVILRQAESQPVINPGSGQPLQYRIKVGEARGGFWHNYSNQQPRSV